MILRRKVREKWDIGIRETRGEPREGRGQDRERNGRSIRKQQTTVTIDWRLLQYLPTDERWDQSIIWEDTCNELINIITNQLTYGILISQVDGSWVVSQWDRREREAFDDSNNDEDWEHPEHLLKRKREYISSLSLSHWPSVYSAWSSPRYASHLLPITLPHVKQRTGMIITACRER